RLRPRSTLFAYSTLFRSAVALDEDLYRGVLLQRRRALGQILLPLSGQSPAIELKVDIPECPLQCFSRLAHRDLGLIGLGRHGGWGRLHRLLRGSFRKPLQGGRGALLG